MSKAASADEQVPDSFDLWLVLLYGKPLCARPSELQARVYASGISRQEGVKIIEGTFIPNKK